MLKLDQMAVKAFEGRTLYIGDEPVVFERNSRVPTPSGRGRQVPFLLAGSEALVAKVQFRGRRHALKLLLLPSPLRMRRIAFLERLKLHEIGLPTLAAAPLVSCHGILDSADFGVSPQSPLELLGYISAFVEGGQQLKELMSPSNPRWDALSRPARIRLAAQLASAVLALERSHLAHSDLQPGNLLLTHLDSAEPQLWLIDFDGFYHPESPWTPILPAAGGRVLGFSGYIHPSVQQSRLIRSDRMALAVLCFELVVLRCAHFAKLGGYGLFKQSDLNAGQVRVPEEIQALWPEGWQLLQRTLGATSYETEGAAPGEWLNALMALDRSDAPAACSYYLRVRLPNVAEERRLGLSTDHGTLAMISPELAWLHYQVTDAKSGAPRLRLYGTIAHPAIFRFRGGEPRSKLQDVDFDAQGGDLFRWKGFQILIESGGASS